jgi:hypothetical protein
MGGYKLQITTKETHLNFPIVNFLFIYSNMPAALANGVHISQLMRHSRACGSNQDFLDGEFLLVKLKSSLLKFYGPHQDLVDCYEIYVSQMATDMFHVS